MAPHATVTAQTMKRYESRYYSLSIPDAWQGEFDDEEEYDIFFHPDGPGELQISAVMQEEALEYEDLEEIAAEDIQGGARTEKTRCGEFSGFLFDYDVDDEYWCEWYLAKGRLMLFITYTCPTDDEDKETADIELIMGTLQAGEDSGVAH